MPGNGVGDRVHNFFAQENLPQGLRSQDGNWPINDNLGWVGNQKQFSVSDSNSRNYNPQQSETERGHGGQRVPEPNIFNNAQTNARPEFSRSLSQPHHEQPNSNGYMYGRQNFQTRPDEANFLGVDTGYGRNNNVNQRGFPFYESQPEAVADQTPKNPIRPESSEVQGSFDLFGGQHQQMNSQYPGLMQPLQQQSGFGEIQQLQQQLMFRKMQELQRQELQRQELQSRELQRQEVIRQQNSLNQPSSFARQASGSNTHGVVNGTPTSDTSTYGWAEPATSNTNWLHRASPAMHPEQGQPHRSLGFSQQQVEPSLYGFPVAGSRGPLNQYPHNNSLPGNMFAAIPEQHMVPSKGLFGNSFGQGSSSRGNKMEHIQQLNTPQNPSVQESSAEMIQDKSATDAEASLDPDEEKILFGSDDNIWEAFGSSKNMGGGVSSLLDDNDFANNLPSMQSGSWSALMQSAVAETTSSGGGVGTQEEWPDLNFRNPELPPDKHPSTHEDTGKHQIALGNINVPTNDKNMGFQRHARNNPYEHNERLNVNDSKQMNQLSSGGSNWLNRGALQNADVKENRLYDNSVPGQRTSQQQHGTSQPNNKQNHWIGNESFLPSANTGFNINANANSLQQPQSNDWKRVAMSNYAGAIPNISNLQGGGNQVNQFSPNNSHLNHWKHVDSSGKSKGSENSEKSQHRLNNKGPQVSESSFNSSDKEDLKMQEMESSSRRENSNDSYRSSSSHLPNTKFPTDAGDSRSLPGTKQSLSNQAGRKTSGQPKFQFHPMGNLDEDVGIPYGPRQGTNTTAISLQHSRGLGHNQGNFGPTKTSGQGFVPEVEGVPKGSDDMRFKGMIPGHMPNIFASHDRSAGLSTSDKASQPSQNMLELLHKVDQSRDRGITRHLNSVEHNLSSEMPEPENSDGSFGGHQRSQSSNSQGIGLQLGPPSQRLPMSMQAVKPNSLIHPQGSANSRGKGHAESSLVPPTHETSHGDFKNDRINISGQSESQMAGHKTLTGFPAALGTEFSNSRNQLQNHPTSGNESFNGHTSQSKQADETHGRSLSSGPYDNAASSEKSLASQLRANSGMSQQGAIPKMLPNSWSNLQSQQLFSAAQARKSNPSPSHQLNIVESTSLVQPKLEEQEAEKRGNSLSKYGATHGITSVGEQSTEKVDQGQMMNGPAAGNNSINTPFSDTSSFNPTASQRDIEAFGRSLKPNNFHQNYSLLSQMKAMKNADNDPENRVLKRLKESDNFSSVQQVVPPRDSEMPRFTGQTDNVEGNVASVPRNLPSKDGPATDQNGSQSGISSNIMTSGKTEHSHISPQMAPSWFDQYGTFKGGQILSQRTDAVRTVETPFSIEKVSSSLETHDPKETPSGAPGAIQGGVILKTPVPSSVAVEQFSSPPVHANISAQNLVIARSKKRKFFANELQSWLKEVSGTVKNPQGICTASMGWCEATNRLMEKVEDDGELIEDVPRPKRRIILSTQLMQQLFPPPPARFLSTDATSNYVTVAFYASRLALGDACNLVSSSGSSNLLLSDKSKESERMDDHRISEIVEECLSKANRLESDFLRLDKRASILDLRVECQDLEKFSIINRFAKFHGRGQAEGGEASSSDTAAANTPKPSPQRYVIAVALPKNLPERVQCLSL